MEWHSTQEVANIIGVHKTTLKRWLRSGAIREPGHKKIVRQDYRIWSKADLEKARKFKQANYRKKPRHKKAGKSKTRKSKS